MKNIFLASNLKYLRKQKNITQKQVANFLGKSDVAIFYYENGEREPSAVDLGKLSILFNVSVNDLLLKDLRNPDDYFDELEDLFIRFKHLLTEDDRDTIRFIIEKRVKEEYKQ